MSSSNNDTDWRHGYETALDYSAGLYPHLFPEHLNYVCVLHGVEPPAAGRAYTYFELGCGRAGTVGTLAASNPRARFFANDFMPSHVAEGRARAQQAGLRNLSLFEESFEDLATGGPELPQFDYITMQGVYTWVAPEVRRQIVAFLARRLKPGGVVSLGYNAMPGWAASTPLQRLMRAGSRWATGDGRQRVEQVRQLMQLLAGAEAEVVKDCAATLRRLGRLQTASPEYLQHEFLNGHWHPMYHADVAEELAAAKLDFVGSAMLPMHGCSFAPEQQALLDAIPDAGWRETAKDYILGTPLRTDVFVRGRRALPPARRQQRLDGFSVALTAPLDTVLQRLAEKNAGLAEAFRPVLVQLATRPCRIGELGPAGGFGLPADVAQLLVAMLSMNRHACVFEREAEDGKDSEAADAARAWNAVVAADALQGSDCTALASPLTGGGIDGDLPSLAVLQQILRQPDAAPEPLAQQAVQALQALAAQPADAPTTQHRQVSRVLEQQLPIWRHLGLL
jgi:SAM-dependent methyltransferase